MRKLGLSTLAGCLLFPAVVLAHYPWFSAESAKDSKAIRFVFEDGIAPGTGEYLDPFIKTGEFWLRTPAKKQPVALKFEDVKKGKTRWLTFSTGQEAPRALDCYCKWGVYNGNLLFYYARHLDVASVDQLAALARADKLKFDLVPRVAGDMMEIQVVWEGKPAPGKPLAIYGPQFKLTVTSDDKGIARFKPGERGLYRMRAQFIEPEPAGMDNGMAYKGLRQTATMTINLPIGASAK